MSDRPSIIRPLSEGKFLYGINMFLYGDPGTGKTPLIANHPRTLILDADHGVDSAIGAPADVWVVDSWIDMDEAYDYLRHEDHGYEWVWFDGFGVGQDRLLTGIMENLVAPQAQGGEGKSHRKLWQADKGEHGQNMFRLVQWFQHMTAMRINFGATSHPWRYEDFVTGEEKVMPWVQGKNMPEKISGMMNVIGYLHLDPEDEDKRMLRVKPHNNYYARDRSGTLGAGLVNPTIEKIERLITAKFGTMGATRKATSPAKKAAVKKAAATTKTAQRVVPRKRS